MRMVLTSCFQEFNIISKRSFSIVLAAVFVYTCDILKTSSFLFVHMWFEERKKKKAIISMCVLLECWWIERLWSRGSNLDYSWSMHVWKSCFDWKSYAHTHFKSEASENYLIWYPNSKIESSFVWYNNKAN